jgi:hypothetical protein
VGKKRALECQRPFLIQLDVGGLRLPRFEEAGAGLLPKIWSG